MEPSNIPTIPVIGGVYVMGTGDLRGRRVVVRRIWTAYEWVADDGVYKGEALRKEVAKIAKNGDAPHVVEVAVKRGRRVVADYIYLGDWDATLAVRYPCP